jgi:hypothetical protein
VALRGPVILLEAFFEVAERELSDSLRLPVTACRPVWRRIQLEHVCLSSQWS